MREFQYARRFRQYGVARVTQHLAAADLYLAADVVEQFHDARVHADLVAFEQAAVAGDIGIEDGGQFMLRKSIDHDRKHTGNFNLRYRPALAAICAA